MIKNINKNMIELTWNEVNESITKLSPELAGIINNLSPGQDLTLYKVSYPFGQAILDAGTLVIPIDDNKFTHINDTRIPPQIKKDLIYTPTMPTGILLSKAIDISLTTPKSLLSSNIIHPGSIFGLTVSITPESAPDEKGIWTLTAGARSIFMIPKISSQTHYRHFEKQLGLILDAPKNINDQWPVFKKIYNKMPKTQEWQTEVLFFSHKWFKKLSDPGWIELRHYFLQYIWQKLAYWRNSYAYDPLFSQVHFCNEKKLDPELMTTINHLFKMGAGAYPGFAVATDNLLAPINVLEKAYNEIYGLGEYAPIFMVPQYLTTNNPVYYSLNHPTKSDFTVSFNKSSNRIRKLRDLEILMSEFTSEMLRIRKDSNPGGYSIHDNVKSLRFNYFHNEDTSAYSKIHNASEIYKFDKNLAMKLKKFKGKRFADKNPFFCGTTLINKDPI